jgi:hypothetical protein
MRLGNHGTDYLAIVRYNVAREPTAQLSKMKNIIDSRIALKCHMIYIDKSQLRIV